jgi:uncharacterized protein (DUF58 family)
VRIARLDLKARLIVEGFIAGLHKSPFHGFSVEFAQHREYVPGDDIKHIDWRVYGKSDRYYIKQYEEETNLRAYVLLDISESMGYASGAVSKLEYGRYIAASLTHLLLGQQDSVGLALFGDEVRRFVRDSSHPSHKKLLLHEIEACEPAGKTKADSVFHELAERFKRRGMVIIISDLFDDPLNIIAGLRHFRHKRHEVIVFHVLDPYERQFPFQDLTLFKGMEEYPQVFAEPRSLREEYLKALDDFTTTVRRGCRQHRIDFVPLTTTDPLDVALSSYLAKRMSGINVRGK